MILFKKCFLVFVLFITKITLVLATSVPEYGVVVDVERRNIVPTIRTVLFSFTNKRVEEVNYYHNYQGSNKFYALKNEEKHISNPILGFNLHKDNDHGVVVSLDFSLEKYILLSQFSLYKSTSSVGISSVICEIKPTMMLDSEKFKVFAANRQPIQHDHLTSVFNGFDRRRFEFNPTFRFIDTTSQDLTRTAGHLVDLFGGKANFYKDHKDTLGENMTFLHLLFYGYSNIYRANFDIHGIDLVACSGNNPQQNSLLIIDCEWTSQSSKSETYIKGKINNHLIAERIVKLRENPKMQQVLDLLSSFFTTSNSKIYKLLYRIHDRPTGKKRGLAKPSLEKISEEERITIAEKGGLLEVHPSPMNALTNQMVTLKILPQMMHDPNDVVSCQKFMEFLGQQPGVSLIPDLWEYFRQKYPVYYQNFFNQK